MAPFWLSLWLILWSLLAAGSFRLPTLRLLVQDGGAVEDVESSSIPANAGSQLASPGQWVWKTAGDSGRESPQSPCGEKDGGCKHPPAATAEQAKKSLTVTEAAAESSTSLGGNYNGASAEVPTNVTTTLYPFGKVSTEAGSTKEGIHLSTTRSACAPVPRVRRLAPTVGTALSQSMPAETEKVASALQETRMVLGVTEKLLVGATSSQSMVASSDVSTAKLRQAIGTTGPSFKVKVAILATTAKVKPPSIKSLNGATILVGKCLLWIFILALIAGIFIVATGVLATMLCRQKQAYKMNERNHTEMVCISSLLAAEEAEEAGGRHPRVKRVKMLGENGSEVDMDNLTLNSFLPEH